MMRDHSTEAKDASVSFHTYLRVREGKIKYPLDIRELRHALPAHRTTLRATCRQHLIADLTLYCKGRNVDVVMSAENRCPGPCRFSTVSVHLTIVFA
jgi:hypothetical protein